MAELIIGLIVLVAWAIMQFVVQLPTAWIHLALAAGVVLVVRGIVRAEPGDAPGSPIKRG